jgi:DNA-binding NarL/FixJ family response regulator
MWAGAEEIMQSLTRVLSGEVSFPRYIIERSRGQSSVPRELPGSATESSLSALGELTKRERDVLEMLGKGLSITNSAAKLNISPQTVRVHLGNAMKKLGLKERSEAIHFAITHAGKT